MLEIADKLGSVLSALIGLVGLGLTVYGLRLQRRATRPTAPPPIANAPLPPEPTDPPRLEVPSRSAWVPSSEHLPPGSPWSPPGFDHAPQMQQPYVPGRAAPSRTVLFIGLVLLAVAVTLGVVTWVL